MRVGQPGEASPAINTTIRPLHIDSLLMIHNVTGYRFTSSSMEQIVVSLVS